MRLWRRMETERKTNEELLEKVEKEEYMGKQKKQNTWMEGRAKMSGIQKFVLEGKTNGKRGRKRIRILNNMNEERDYVEFKRKKVLCQYSKPILSGRRLYNKLLNHDPGI